MRAEGGYLTDGDFLDIVETYLRENLASLIKQVIARG